MFPFLRFSAVMASIVVASTAFGFGLGSAVSEGGKYENYRTLSGISVFPPSNIEKISKKSHSISSLRDISFDFARRDLGNVPAVNMSGPRPGAEHADLGSACGAASSCLMAMN